MVALTHKQLTDLTGKTAIVTGGAAGIGLGIVKRLAEAGANVVIADIDGDAAKQAVGRLFKADQLSKEEHGKVIAISADVSKKDSVSEMVEKAVFEFGEINILVNNAGIFPNMLIMNMKEEDFEKVLAVNLKGIFLCTQTVATHMIKQNKGGRIINITSIDALHPSSTGLAHYDASKHGAWGFTKNVALELAPHKIWVNAVAPGGIRTPGVKVLRKKMKIPKGVDIDELMKNFLAKIPMGRMGEPDDIAKVVLFLASDMASYMTGSQIVVDGGVLLA